ncbi:MAG: hypothetical protein WD317_09215 [Balneolaceae bacterium]
MKQSIDRSNQENHSLLTEKEKQEISGGVWRSALGGLLIHVAVEAYNDWGSHKAAFKEGRASV